MKRTTLFADEQLLFQLRKLAETKGESVAHMVREALRQYVVHERGKKTLSFLGIGKSGRSDVSENAEKLLWKKDK